MLLDRRSLLRVAVLAGPAGAVVAVVGRSEPGPEVWDVDVRTTPDAYRHAVFLDGVALAGAVAAREGAKPAALVVMFEEAEAGGYRLVTHRGGCACPANRDLNRWKVAKEPTTTCIPLALITGGITIKRYADGDLWPSGPKVHRFPDGTLRTFERKTVEELTRVAPWPTAGRADPRHGA